jgi:hypothetical protein
LSSTVLRQINFRDAREKLLATNSQAALTTKAAAALAKFERDALRAALDKGASTDDYLALLAYLYLMRLADGRKPVDSLAEDLGRNPATVKGHLWQAQKRGLLQDRHAGRKGGKLSPAAEAIVEPYALAWIDEFERLNNEATSRTEDKPVTLRSKT